MNIAILGAGGIGGYLAAKLTRAGHPVSLIARGAHLDAMREDGLRLIEPEGTHVVHPAELTDDPAGITVPDVLIVTVKGHQLADALRAIAPAVGPDTRVMTVQNGVDAPDMAAEAFGRDKVLIGVARIFCNITGPGEVTRYGPIRSFVIGALDGSQRDAPVPELRALFESAGVDAPDCDDVRVDLWRKFLVFNAMSSSTAGARTRAGTVRDTPPLAALARRLMQEVFDVGRAEGVPLPAEAVDETWALFESLPAEGRASTAHDLELGRALEIDNICGSVARRGRRLGVDVTASETVYALLAPYRTGTPG